MLKIHYLLTTTVSSSSGKSMGITRERGRSCPCCLTWEEFWTSWVSFILAVPLNFDRFLPVASRAWLVAWISWSTLHKCSFFWSSTCASAISCKKVPYNSGNSAVIGCSQLQLHRWKKTYFVCIVIGVVQVSHFLQLLFLLNIEIVINPTYMFKYPGIVIPSIIMSLSWLPSRI